MTDMGTVHWEQATLVMDELGLEVGLRQFRDTSSVHIKRISDGKVFNIWCRDDQIVAPLNEDPNSANVVSKDIYISISNLGKIETLMGNVETISILKRYFIERDKKLSSGSQKGSSFVTMIYVI